VLFRSRRAAVWFLEGGGRSPEAAITVADDQSLRRRESELSSPTSTRPQTWMMVANPAEWSWSELFTATSMSYSYGKIRSHYPKIRIGDIIVGYESTPTKRVVALARVVGKFDPSSPDDGIRLEPLQEIPGGPTYGELSGDPILSMSEPIRLKCQGTLFALSPREADRMFELISASSMSSAPQHIPRPAQLTRLTFHPSYTYEDFVEGFRPVSRGDQGLQLELVDGIFKRVCRAATADPDQDFVLLIDEINRGNVPKIFGELITLLESDKRGLTVDLAQSGVSFAVPQNLFIIGTMNTADRSIHLLDTALRRRFGFIELLPDASTLSGANVNGLDLSLFLDELNARIRSDLGREHQIGHALFFEDGEILSSAEAFAAAFRHELLPLLQEYFYEDYARLFDLLGDVIDVDGARISPLVDDPDALIDALCEKFPQASAS